MRFKPSPHSYGSTSDAYSAQLMLTTYRQGEDVGDFYGDGEVSALEPQPVPASGSGGAANISQYLDIGISAAKSLFGLDSGERESVATLEAKVANYRASAARAPSLVVAGVPLPGGKEYYQNLARKAESQLLAARELAAEEARAAAINEARNIGYTVLVFMGGAVVLGLAVNQFQKARIHAAEVRRLQRETE